MSLLAFRGHVSVDAVGVTAPMVFEKTHIDAQYFGAAGYAEIWVLKQTAHSYFCKFAAPGICTHTFIGKQNIYELK